MEHTLDDEPVSPAPADLAPSQRIPPMPRCDCHVPGHTPWCATVEWWWRHEYRRGDWPTAGG